MKSVAKSSAPPSFVRRQLVIKFFARNNQAFGFKCFFEIKWAHQMMIHRSKKKKTMIAKKNFFILIVFFFQ